MGCCNTSAKTPQEEILVERLKNAIESDSAERIRIVFALLEKVGSKMIVNEKVFEDKEYKLSPFAYSVLIGRCKAFKCLYEEYSASVEDLEKSYSEIPTSPLEIMCKRGYHELLVYYIPLFMDFIRKKSCAKEDISITVDFDRTVENLPRICYTPVQKACELGNIHILLTIFNYFKDKSEKPHELDLEYQEEHTGDNCVLIASRSGNYSMLKFLNEIVKADFRVKNKNDEDAIHSCLIGSKCKPSKLFLECLIYLIETVKLDFTHNYEESLLVAQDREIIQYLECKLESVGIKVKKVDLEQNNQIKVPQMAKTNLDLQLEEEEHFNLRQYIEEKDLDRSALSSISNFESISAPFFSVMSNNISILKPPPN